MASEANEKTLPPVALVTGAGKRIGRAIALGLAADGFAVAVHYNSSSDGADATVEDIAKAGGTAVAFQCDLTKFESAGGLIAEVAEQLGPISVLVNSASLFDEDALETLTPDGFQNVMSVNLAAPVWLMKAFANQRQIPEPAAIVNILDTQMSSPYPGRFSYFVSKFGLEGATKVAAMDLASKGITVNAIAPGLVLPSGQSEDEYLRRQKLTPRGAGLGPGHIVEAVRYFIRARQVTGHVLPVDAGQHLMGFGNIPA